MGLFLLGMQFSIHKSKFIYIYATHRLGVIVTESAISKICSNSGHGL